MFNSYICVDPTFLITLLRVSSLRADRSSFMVVFIKFLLSQAS